MTKKREDHSSASSQDVANDHFWLNSVFPDPSGAFHFQQSSWEEIKDDCFIVLDANVLLMPYQLKSHTLTDLIKCFKKYAEEDRLIIPGQAAREFLKNRGHLLREFGRELRNNLSRLEVPFTKKHPFLDSYPQSDEIEKACEEIRSAKKKLQHSIGDVVKQITGEIGLDPVSKAYRAIFSKSVYDLKIGDKEKSEIIDQMNWRYKNGVPPGYKDKNKDDGGIGDFLIWKTILRIGEEQKANAVFVTEDVKADWVVEAEGVFQPRLELVDEYRRATGGKTLQLMSLSSFLGLSGATDDTVQDTKKIEDRDFLSILKSWGVDNEKQNPKPVREWMGDILGLYTKRSTIEKRLTELSLQSDTLTSAYFEEENAEAGIDLLRKLTEIRREISQLQLDLEATDSAIAVWGK